MKVKAKLLIKLVQVEITTNYVFTQMFTQSECIYRSEYLSSCHLLA